MKEVILIIILLIGVALGVGGLPKGLAYIFCSTDLRFFFLKKTAREKRKLMRKILNSLSEEEWKVNDANEYIEFYLHRKEKEITTLSEVKVRFSYKNGRKRIKLERIDFNIIGIDSSGDNASFRESTSNFFLIKSYSSFFKNIVYKKNDEEILSSYKKIDDRINLTFKSIKRDKRDKKINKILNKSSMDIKQ